MKNTLFYFDQASAALDTALAAENQAERRSHLEEALRFHRLALQSAGIRLAADPPPSGAGAQEQGG